MSVTAFVEGLAAEFDVERVELEKMQDRPAYLVRVWFKDGTEERATMGLLPKAEVPDEAAFERQVRYSVSKVVARHAGG